MAATTALAPSRQGPFALRLPRPSDLRALLIALLSAALIASVLTAVNDFDLAPTSTTAQEESVSGAVESSALGNQTVLPRRSARGTHGRRVGRHPSADRSPADHHRSARVGRAFAQHRGRPRAGRHRERARQACPGLRSPDPRSRAEGRRRRCEHHSRRCHVDLDYRFRVEPAAATISTSTIGGSPPRRRSPTSATGSSSPRVPSPSTSKPSPVASSTAT